MSATAVFMDTPAVPSDWTVTHEAYEARFTRAGLRTGCLGVFRVTENDGKGPAVATCDVCAHRIGVLQPQLAGERPSSQRRLDAEPF